MRRLPIAVSMLVVGAGLTIGPSTASLAQPTAPSAAACGLNLGSVTAGGDHVVQHIDASNPPTAGAKTVTPNLYADGAAKLSSRWNAAATSSGTERSGSVVLGSSLYQHAYGATSSGAIDPAVPAHLTRVGGGWDRFTYFESSTFWYTLTAVRSEQYGLRDDGTLFRWSIGEEGSWQSTGSATGFAAVKGMASISTTRTYDTFLANTSDGALDSIRIPLTQPMRPVWTKIRSTTWQVFESLVAGRCLDDSTVLVGIDKDTDAAYAYVISHAEGTATTIFGMGKLPLTFADPVYFRWAPDTRSDPLFGG